MDGAVMVADVQAGFQHQGDGELADGIAAVVGHVAHGDALFLGIGHVHHVVAGGQHRDELQVGTAVNDLPGHGGLVDDSNLRVTDPADGFILIAQADAVIVCHLTQGFQRGPAQVAGILGIAVQYYDFHNSNLLYKIEFHLLKYRWTQGKKCGIMEPINQGGRPCLKPHLPGLHPINPRKKRSPFWNCFQRRRDLCACGTSVPLWD